MSTPVDTELKSWPGFDVDQYLPPMTDTEAYLLGYDAVPDWGQIEPDWGRIARIFGIATVVVSLLIAGLGVYALFRFIGWAH